MSTIFLDSIYIDGLKYTTGAAPLEPWLDSLPVQPSRRSTMFTLYGYVAEWAVGEDMLYLTGITPESRASPLVEGAGPVAATWFSGLVHGWRAERRYTGYPVRTFRNDEIVLMIESGKVVRQWTLDLRCVPDQTSEELRLWLPAFLLKAAPDPHNKT